MKKILLFVAFLGLILGINTSAFAQKNLPFEGQLMYQVRFLRAYDSTVMDHSFQTIFTNDTLVRIESFSEQLGPQVVIKHLILGKYYILLEANDQKYAIQQTIKPDSVKTQYIYKKKRGKKTVFGMKAKKVLVSHPNWTKSLVIWYLPEVSSKYIDAYSGIPGLPLAYEIHTEDGVYQYSLQRIQREEVSKDQFGIPSHFKKVTFDQFMDEMIQEQTVEPPQ